MGNHWGLGFPADVQGSEQAMPLCQGFRCAAAGRPCMVCSISPANVVGKAHWYSDKLTVRGPVPWRQTMVRIPAGAKLLVVVGQSDHADQNALPKQTTVGVGPSHGQAVHTPPSSTHRQYTGGSGFFVCVLNGNMP